MRANGCAAAPSSTAKIVDGPVNARAHSSACCKARTSGEKVRPKEITTSARARSNGGNESADGPQVDRNPEDPSLVFTVIQSTGVRADLRDNYKCTPRRCALKSEGELS
jgi:hypothetical protein